MRLHFGAEGGSERDGAVLFGRYAFPPNERHLCGPDRAGELLERVSERASGPALEEVAREFAGAWPYLAMIGECLGKAPLDAAVVEAYWLGGPAVRRCAGGVFARSLEERFRSRMTRLEFERMVAAVEAGGTPHHNFHVFAVYPWVGLLRGGRGDQPLQVLDQCRIRWGRVRALDGDTAMVATHHLVWDGHELGLGPPVTEPVRLRRDGHMLARPVREGDWVSLHWDWVCDVLSLRDLAHLRMATEAELTAVNTCRYSAPATVLA